MGHELGNNSVARTQSWGCLVVSIIVGLSIIAPRNLAPNVTEASVVPTRRASFKLDNQLSIVFRAPFSKEKRKVGPVGTHGCQETRGNKVLHIRWELNEVGPVRLHRIQHIPVGVGIPIQQRIWFVKHRIGDVSPKGYQENKTP